MLLRHVMIDKFSYLYSIARPKEDLSDIMMDFYLYIRDGKSGKNKRIFQGLEGIRSALMFESWMTRTFKNFLIDKVSIESREKESKDILKSEGLIDTYDDEKDRKIRYMGILFAYVDSAFSSQNRFIFFRSLLLKLRKTDAIPSEDIAGAMGLTYDNYRKIDSRLRRQVQDKLEDIQKGNIPELDINQKKIVNRTIQEFENLFDVILDLYQKALDSLSCRDAIEELRREGYSSSRIEDDSTMSHVLFRRRKFADEEIVEPSSPELKIDFSDLSIKLKCWRQFNEFLDEYDKGQMK